MTTVDGPTVALDDVFGAPERDMPRLSPDGRRLAWLAPTDGVPDVWVADAPGGDRPRRLTHAPPPGIALYCWAPDDRHLLYVLDDRGDEDWRLYAVDATSGATRVLTPAGAQADVLAVDAHHPHHVLAALDARSPGLADAHRIDLDTGARTLVAENPGGVERWFADPRHRVRVATVRRDDGGLDILHRRGADGPWQVALHLGPDDALASGPVAVPDTGILLVSTAGTGALDAVDPGSDGTARLVHLDPATGTIDVVAARPGHDVDALLLDPRTHRPRAVAFAAARRTWQALDPAIVDDLVALERLHPGDLTIVGQDRQDRYWLVSHAGPDEPGAHHLWDRATQTAHHLFDQRPALAGHLAATQPFRCRARDGLALPGYWTPPDPGRGPHPTVVLVHGGPWFRDTWEWDPQVAWLTTRGYGCLRVDFRGSTGWGRRHVHAGHRQWGLAMQDDLHDAVAHAVAEDWVDPDRVAIMGASYGGYAALLAATATPGRFRCAVSLAGPTDLVAFLQAVPADPPSARRLWWSRVGDPTDPTDAARLRRTSPLAHLDPQASPMFVAHGAHDPRVPAEQTDRFVVAARDAGATVEQMTLPGEGHGLAATDSVVAFHAAAERFLARHLPTSRSAL